MKNNYLTLGGLFACLHVLFLVASKVIVGSEILLVLMLPLLSTIYTMKCEKKHVVMFVIATILVCCIFDVISTFIYIIPSLVCGILYGFLRKKNFKELELLCITSIGHFFSLLFSFLVISFLFKEVSFVELFSEILDLNGDRLMVASLLILFVLGFCEAFLVHVISDSELAKLATKVEKNNSVPDWFLFGYLFSLVLFFVTYFVNNLLSVFPMLLSFIFIVPYIVYGIMNYRYKVLTTGLMFLFAFISVFLFKYINPLNYLIIASFVLIPIIINNFENH